MKIGRLIRELPDRELGRSELFCIFASAAVASLVLFFYQFLSLFNSGVEESAHVLGVCGLISAVWVLFACMLWRRVRPDARAFRVAILVGVSFGTWACYAYMKGAATGGPAIYYRVMSGYTRNIDGVFFATLVSSLKNLGVPSLLFGGIVPMRYHIGVHWLAAGIARVCALSGLAMTGCVIPMLLVPFLIVSSLLAVRSVRALFQENRTLSLGDMLVYLAFFVGVLPSGWMASAGLYYHQLCHSESMMLGTIMMFVFVAVSAFVLRKQLNHAIGGMLKWIVLPVFVLAVTYVKVSSGHVVMLLIVGYGIFVHDWHRGIMENLRLLAHVGLCGAFFLVGYVMVTDVGLDGSSQTCKIGLQTAMTILRHPLQWGMVCLPLILLVTPRCVVGWSTLRNLTVFVLLLSLLPFLVFDMYGGSNVYFWHNGYYIVALYLVASRAVWKFFGERWHGRMVFFVILAMVAVNIGNLQSFRRAVRFRKSVSMSHGVFAPYAETQEGRYKELCRGREFVSKFGAEKMLGYVTADYFIHKFDKEYRAKGGMYLMQAYLGIPMIGTCKIENGHAMVRVDGKYVDVGSVAQYSPQMADRLELPEFTDGSAVEYARTNGYRWLLKFGRGDALNIVDVKKTGF